MISSPSGIIKPHEAGAATPHLRKKSLMATKQTTHLVKIGDHGSLTIALPEMAGQYLLVEQSDAKIVLRPYDLAFPETPVAIAHCGESWAMLGLDHPTALQM